MVDPGEFASVLANLNGNGTVSQSEFNLVFSNYLTSGASLRMQNVSGLGGSNVNFDLANFSFNQFSTETSTNLTNWQYLGPVNVRYGFTDTNPPTSQRLYRLRWP